jgi:DNA ligase-1
LNPLEREVPDQRLRFKEKNIDVWFEPQLVFEIKAADFTCSPTYTAAIGKAEEGKGISLRFPWFVRERTDKTPEEATDSTQIFEMYKSQQSIENNFNFDD